MFVSRSEVSCRDSIHLDCCVTGAKAMSSSEEGSALPSAFDLTKRSVADGEGIPGSIGFQSVAGTSVSARVTLRGPVRRSRYVASDCRHESAASCRSAGVRVTCISFSASAKVPGETGGPAPAPVPQVGGAPAVDGVDCELLDGDSSRQAVAAMRKPSGALMRNCRRVFIGSGAYYYAVIGATRSVAQFKAPSFYYSFSKIIGPDHSVPKRHS